MKSNNVTHLVASTLVVALSFCGACWAATEDGLVGHWKLAGDCRDSSGRENHGINHGVNLTAEGAKFDGIANYIEVPDSKSLDLGTSDWSIAAWIHTKAEMDDVLGDVLSKYDPASRVGVNFSLMNYVGATSAQSNYRNLFLGIDAGRIDPTWTDCGRPGKSQFTWALTVYDGHLYAGTWEPGKGEAGHVYRYEGGSEWTDCGSPDPCNAVSALAECGGRLYAGVSYYGGPGSALPPSPNKNRGGKVYRYEGGTRWTDCGKVDPDEWMVFGIVNFREQLYCQTNVCDDMPKWPKPKSEMYRYDGDKKWTSCGLPGNPLGALAVFNGDLYATIFCGLGKQGFARYDGGTKWTTLGVIPGVVQPYSTVIYQGQLCIGTWPHGTVFRYDVPGKFTSLGRLGSEKEVMGMAVYNGSLYGGTLPLGAVYRYDGDQTWTLTGQLDTTPNVVYRRAWSMAVCQGKLFAGVLPSGRVYCLEAGKGASYDRALPPGWRHVTAVKAGGRLKLYVDGGQVAESTAFEPANYNLSNRQPLRIGAGEHDFFNGKMKDLRIYGRALPDEDLRALCKQ